MRTLLDLTVERWIKQRRTAVGNGVVGSARSRRPFTWIKAEKQKAEKLKS